MGKNGGTVKDIVSKIRYDRTKWQKETRELCDKKGSLKMKGKFYKAVVKSEMMYGSEC